MADEETPTPMPTVEEDNEVEQEQEQEQEQAQDDAVPNPMPTPTSIWTPTERIPRPQQNSSEAAKQFYLSNRSRLDDQVRLRIVKLPLMAFVNRRTVSK
jgi:phosphopantothenoylcysteine synthetase/decarboxylase